MAFKGSPAFEAPVQYRQTSGRRGDERDPGGVAGTAARMHTKPHDVPKISPHVAIFTFPSISSISYYFHGCIFIICVQPHSIHQAFNFFFKGHK